MEERSLDPGATPYDRRSIASSISDIASVFNDEKTTEKI